MLKWVGINLYLVNRCLLIKFDRPKNAKLYKPLAFLDGVALFLPPLVEYQP